MQRYTINQIRSELERNQGEPYTDEQFKLLLAGFTAYALRQRLYSAVGIFKARKRGWMSAQMAHFFKLYAAQ